MKSRDITVFYSDGGTECRTLQHAAETSAHERMCQLAGVDPNGEAGECFKDLANVWRDLMTALMRIDGGFVALAQQHQIDMPPHVPDSALLNFPPPPSRVGYEPPWAAPNPPVATEE